MVSIIFRSCVSESFFFFCIYLLINQLYDYVGIFSVTLVTTDNLRMMKLESAPSGDLASIVKVASVPDCVLAGGVTVSVALEYSPDVSVRL